MKTNNTPNLQTLVAICQRFVSVLLLASLPMACQKSDDAAPAKTCKLRTSTYQGSGSPSTTNYEYNPDGQLKSLLSASGSRSNYAYDGNGYLSVVSSVNTSGAVTSSSQVEFTSGRLSRILDKNATGTTVGTTQYEYDQSGSLSRVVETLGSSTITHTFSGGKQTGYTSRSSSGAETQPYVFENGLVKRYTTGSTQNLYEYDPQGRRTRYETYGSGKLTSYVVYEYADGKSPDDARNSFKGVPEILFNGLPQTGINALIAKQTYYTVSSTGLVSKYYEIATTYTKNASGFPTESNAVSRDYNISGAVTSTSAYKYTYVYADCL